MKDSKKFWAVFTAVAFTVGGLLFVITTTDQNTTPASLVEEEPESLNQSTAATATSDFNNHEKAVEVPLNPLLDPVGSIVLSDDVSEVDQASEIPNDQLLNEVDQAMIKALAMGREAFKQTFTPEQHEQFLTLVNEQVDRMFTSDHTGLDPAILEALREEMEADGEIDEIYADVENNLLTTKMLEASAAGEFVIFHTEDE